MMIQLQDQIRFAAGAFIVGAVVFAAYKLIYEWRANRALTGKKARYSLPSLKTVILIYGTISLVLLFYMALTEQDQKNVCAEGGVVDRQVVNSELNEMEELAQIYQEEHEGNIYIQVMREDPYFDLIMYQNSEDNDYLMMIRSKETFKIHPDHYYRLYFARNNPDSSNSSYITVSGTELQNGFFAYEAGVIQEERCGLITTEYRVFSFGEDPDEEYLDHTLSIQVRKEVRDQ